LQVRRLTRSYNKMSASPVPKDPKYRGVWEIEILIEIENPTSQMNQIHN